MILNLQVNQLFQKDTSDSLSAIQSGFESRWFSWMVIFLEHNQISQLVVIVYLFKSFGYRSCSGLHICRCWRIIRSSIVFNLHLPTHSVPRALITVSSTLSEVLVDRRIRTRGRIPFSSLSWFCLSKLSLVSAIMAMEPRKKGQI